MQSSHRYSFSDLDIVHDTAKRRKTTRACDVCKSQKKKCTGTQPCEPCMKAGRQCDYLSVYARGRTPPLHPVSDHAHALINLTPATPPKHRNSSLVQPSDHSSADQEYRPTAKPKETESPASPQPQHYYTRLDPSNIIPNRSQLPRQSNHASWLNDERSGQPSIDPSRRLSSELADEDLAGHYLGPSSAISWLTKAWRQLGRAQRDLRQHIEGMSTSDSVLNYGDGPKPLSAEIETPLRLNETSLKSTKLLLGIFFERSSVTYRYLHRPSVMSWLSQLHASQEQQESPMSAARGAVVLSALANASVYMSPEEWSSMIPKDRAELDCERVFSAAKRELDRERGPPSLESIQARLIQVHYLLSSSRPNQAWFMFGTVVQLTLALGLHRKRLMKDSTSPLLREMRKRVFWAVYTSDRYISIALGRPTLVEEEIISQELPQPVNDEDLGPTALDLNGEEDCLTSAAIMQARLAQIVHKSLRNQPNTRNSLMVPRISEHNEALEQWRSELPPFLSGAIKPSSLIPVYRRQMLVLNTFYMHAVMIVNRPLLLRSLSQSWNGRDAQSLAFQPYLKKCIDAAKTVADLGVQFEVERQKFEVYWFTQNITFNALSIIYLYILRELQTRQTLLPEESSLLKLADKCRDSLEKASQKNAPSLRYCWILDVLRGQVRQKLFSSAAANEGIQPSTQSANGVDFSAEKQQYKPSLEEAEDSIEDIDLNSPPEFDLGFWPELDSLPLAYGDWLDEAAYGGNRVAEG